MSKHLPALILGLVVGTLLGVFAPRVFLESEDAPALVELPESEAEDEARTPAQQSERVDRKRDENMPAHSSKAQPKPDAIAASDEPPEVEADKPTEREPEPASAAAPKEAPPPSLAGITPEEERFLRETLAVERERRANSVIQPDDNALTIIDRTFTYGADPLPSLRTRGFLRDRIPDQQGDVIQVKDDAEWRKLQRELHSMEAKAVTIHLAPGEYSELDVRGAIPALTIVGTLGETLDERSEPITDTTRSTLLKGIGTSGDELRVEISLRDMVIVDTLRLNARSALRGENLMIQYFDTGAGGSSSLRISESSAVALTKCVCLSGFGFRPDSRSCVFDPRMGSLGQFEGCRFVGCAASRESKDSIGSKALFFDCVFERASPVDDGSEGEFQTIEIYASVFRHTAAVIAAAQSDEPSKILDLHVCKLDDACRFEEIPPVISAQTLRDFCDRMSNEGGPVMTIYIAEPEIVKQGWAITVQHLPLDWASREVGSECELVVSHWILWRDGRIEKSGEDYVPGMGMWSRPHPKSSVPSAGFQGLETASDFAVVVPGDRDVQSITLKVSQDGSASGYTHFAPRGLLERGQWFDPVTGEAK